MKEIFGFQKLKISLSETLFQKKPPYASLILLFQLGNREKVICKNEKRLLKEFYKSIYDEVINA